MVVLTESNVTHEGYVVFEPGAAAKADMGPHDTEGSDLDLIFDLGPRIDGGILGNPHH